MALNGIKGQSLNKIMSLRPSVSIALSIAFISGYFMESFVTKSLNTNLPKSIAIVAPTEAPIHTDKNPTTIAFHVVPYACLNANPAPIVNIDPGIKNTTQMMYIRHRQIGPRNLWVSTQSRN